MVVALNPIHRAANIQRVVVSTYQAVSGNGLIGRNHNTLDVGCTMDRVQSYHHLNGRTVGIGNQSPMLKCLFRINFRKLILNKHLSIGD